MTFLRWSLASLAAAYVLTIVGLAAFQRRLQYFPDRRLTDLAQTGMSGGEELRLPQHRQAQLLDSLVVDRVREFGYVAEGHRSLGNWVLILRGIDQINHVIVCIIRHKLQRLGNGNPSHGC